MVDYPDLALVAEFKSSSKIIRDPGCVRESIFLHLLFIHEKGYIDIAEIIAGKELSVEIRHLGEGKDISTSHIRWIV